MSDILALTMRPRTFDDCIGQQEIVGAIRAQMSSKRIPRAWMLVGSSGGGKTTLARIIALSYQCSHQQQFGSPCEACRQHAGDYAVMEVNASDVNGIDEIRQIAGASVYQPPPPSRYRVYILDEAHNLSNASQNLLLKPFEDCPKTTVWIICTTNPQKILPTLRRRCVTFNVKPLGTVGTEKIIRRAAKAIGFQGKLAPFIEQVHTFNITSPGLILQYFERYVSGVSAKDAVASGDALQVVTIRICRALVKGDWDSVRAEMKNAAAEDSRMIRGAAVGYLRTMLLGNGIGKSTAAAAATIEDLTGPGPLEDALFINWLAAVLYKSCRRFRA